MAPVIVANVVRIFDLRPDNVGSYTVVQDNDVPNDVLTTIVPYLFFCAPSAPALQQRKPDRSNKEITNANLLGSVASLEISELSSNKRYDRRNSP